MKILFIAFLFFPLPSSPGYLSPPLCTLENTAYARYHRRIYPKALWPSYGFANRKLGIPFVFSKKPTLVF